MPEPRRKKTLLVLLEPDGASKTYQLRIAYRTLRLIVVALVLAVVLFLVALLVVMQTVTAARSARALSAENDSLRMEFGRLSHIEGELAGLKQTHQQLLRLVGVAPADSGLTSKYAIDPGKLLGIWRLSQPTTPPRVGILSRGFTLRNERNDHPGVDVAGPEGSLVVAAGGGIVIGSGQSEIYGNELLIDHGDGIETFYGHSKEILVAIGDSVHVGQPIARLGNTGRSSAPHLHFEVRVDGSPVDPGEFIREYQATNP